MDKNLYGKTVNTNRMKCKEKQNSVWNLDQQIMVKDTVVKKVEATSSIIKIDKNNNKERKVGIVLLCTRLGSYQVLRDALYVFVLSMKVTPNTW